MLYFCKLYNMKRFTNNKMNFMQFENISTLVRFLSMPVIFVIPKICVFLIKNKNNVRQISSNIKKIKPVNIKITKSKTTTPLLLFFPYVETPSFSERVKLLPVASDYVSDNLYKFWVNKWLQDYIGHFNVHLKMPKPDYLLIFQYLTTKLSTVYDEYLVPETTQNLHMQNAFILGYLNHVAYNCILDKIEQIFQDYLAEYAYNDFLIKNHFRIDTDMSKLKFIVSILPTKLKKCIKAQKKFLNIKKNKLLLDDSRVNQINLQYWSIDLHEADISYFDHIYDLVSNNNNNLLKNSKINHNIFTQIKAIINNEFIIIFDSCLLPETRQSLAFAQAVFLGYITYDILDKLEAIISNTFCHCFEIYQKHQNKGIIDYNHNLVEVTQAKAQAQAQAKVGINIELKGVVKGKKVKIKKLPVYRKFPLGIVYFYPAFAPLNSNRVKLPPTKYSSSNMIPDPTYTKYLQHWVLKYIRKFPTLLSIPRYDYQRLLQYILSIKFVTIFDEYLLPETTKTISLKYAIDLGYITRIDCLEIQIKIKVAIHTYVVEYVKSVTTIRLASLLKKYVGLGNYNLKQTIKGGLFRCDILPEILKKTTSKLLFRVKIVKIYKRILKPKFPLGNFYFYRPVALRIPKRIKLSLFILQDYPEFHYQQFLDHWIKKYIGIFPTILKIVYSDSQMIYKILSKELTTIFDAYLLPETTKTLPAYQAIYLGYLTRKHCLAIQMKVKVAVYNCLVEFVEYQAQQVKIAEVTAIYHHRKRFVNPLRYSKKELLVQVLRTRLQLCGTKYEDHELTPQELIIKSEILIKKSYRHLQDYIGDDLIIQTSAIRAEDLARSKKYPERQLSSDEIDNYLKIPLPTESSLILGLHTKWLKDKQPYPSLDRMLKPYGEPDLWNDYKSDESEIESDESEIEFEETFNETATESSGIDDEVPSLEVLMADLDEEITVNSEEDDMNKITDKYLKNKKKSGNNNLF